MYDNFFSSSLFHCKWKTARLHETLLTNVFTWGITWTTCWVWHRYEMWNVCAITRSSVSANERRVCYSTLLKSVNKIGEERTKSESYVQN